MKTKAEVLAALKKGLEEGTIKISDSPELRAWYQLTRDRMPPIASAVELRKHYLDMGSYSVDIDLDKPWPAICRHCGKLGVRRPVGMELCKCPHCGGLN